MNIWQVQISGYPHTGAFDMVALCLRESIRELGFKSEILTYPNPVENQIILGAHLLENFFPTGYIIYNLEQITPESPLVNQDYINLLKMNRVWDYSKRNIKELKKLGIDAVHMPIGYHPILTRITPATEDIDCLFYGSINNRRKEIIENIGAHAIFGVYGPELDDYIARSKIILNCHYYKSELFEIVRCSYLLANKKFVLSERGNDRELESPFEDAMAFHAKDFLKGACEFYLKNPDVREYIANKGFEIFSKMKQTEYLKDESKSW